MPEYDSLTKYDEAKADYGEVSTDLLSQLWNAFADGGVPQELQREVQLHLMDPPELADELTDG